MYAFDQQEFQFEPCTKLTVHFINEDEIRHQWMMHGLPKYLYPKGMFHLEVSGPGEVSGTLILPPGDKTYLVHCDIAQHMEKGMKAQLKVGKGSEDLPSIPGVTNSVFPDDYSGKPYSPEEAAAAAAKASAASSAANANATPNNSNAPTPTETDSGLSGTTVLGIVLGFLIAPTLAKRYKGMSPGEVIASLIEATQKIIQLCVGVLAGLFSKTRTASKK